MTFRSGTLKESEFRGIPHYSLQKIDSRVKAFVEVIFA